MDVFRNQRGKKTRRKLKLRVDAWCWLSETLQQLCVAKKTRLKCIFLKKRNSVLFFSPSKFRYLILKRGKKFGFFFFFVIFWIIGLHGSKEILRASYQENIMLFFFKYHSQSTYLPPQNKTRETQCFLRVGQEQQHLNKQHTQRSSDHRTGNKMHKAGEIPLGGESWCTASREIQRKLCADSDWLLWKSWMNFLPCDRWGRWVSNPRWSTLLDAISLTEWRVFSVSSCSRHQSSSSRVSMASCWCGSSATHEHSKALWEMHLKVWKY